MPKTIKNIYDNSISFEKLLKAHKKARCGKREKKKIILFDLKLEQELLELEKQLKNGTYKHGGYTKFKIYEPKERIIMASEYKDRVRQWDGLIALLFVIIEKSNEYGIISKYKRKDIVVDNNLPHNYKCKIDKNNKEK